MEHPEAESVQKLHPLVDRPGQVERNIHAKRSEDGLLELMFGLLLLISQPIMKSGQGYLLYSLFIALAMVIVRRVQVKVIWPRIGWVRFTNEQGWRHLARLVLYLLIGLLFFAAVRVIWGVEGIQFLADRFGVLFVGLIGLGFLARGLLLSTLYNLLIGIAPLLLAVVGAAMHMPDSKLISFAGGILIVAGIARLLRFVKRYPLTSGGD